MRSTTLAWPHFTPANVDRGKRAFEEALSLARELRDVPHMAAAQFMLAQLAVLAGDAAQAREHAQASLELYTELEDDRSCARCVVVLAGAAAASGQHERSTAHRCG